MFTRSWKYKKQLCQEIAFPRINTLSQFDKFSSRYLRVAASSRVACKISQSQGARFNFFLQRAFRNMLAEKVFYLIICRLRAAVFFLSPADVNK